jgi:hypothetical protein
MNRFHTAFDMNSKLYLITQNNLTFFFQASLKQMNKTPEIDSIADEFLSESRSSLCWHKHLSTARYDVINGKLDDKGRMVSSGMLRRLALVRSDVSEEPSASFIRVTKIGELGTALAATSNRRTLRRNTSDSCHPDEGGAKFLLNIGSYQGHTA